MAPDPRAISAAVNQASEQVTRADVCALELRMVRWLIGVVLGVVLAVAGLQTAVMFGMMRSFH